jgi:hypothetical protein
MDPIREATVTALVNSLFTELCKRNRGQNNQGHNVSHSVLRKWAEDLLDHDLKYHSRLPTRGDVQNWIGTVLA